MGEALGGRRGAGHAAAVAVATLVALGGCGIGDRSRDADAIVEGTRSAFEQGTARGTLAVTYEVVSMPDGMGSVAGIVGGAAAGDPMSLIGQGPPPIVADFVFDFDDEQASLTVAGQDHPFVVFDGMRSYGWRSNATERDARPWVLLDLEELDEGSNELSMTEDSPSIGGFALNPIVLFDLAAGPLAGSVESTGAGAFEANFDIEKVLRDTRRARYDEDRREAIFETLRALTVKGTTHEGRVLLGDDGLPRQFGLRLREEPVKRLKVDLVVDFDVVELGGGASVDIPSASEVVEVDNVVQFLRSVIPPVDSAEFVTFLGLDAPEPAA